MVSVYSVATLIVSSVCSVTALITGVSLFGGTGVLGDSGFLTSVFRLRQVVALISLSMHIRCRELSFAILYKER